MHFANNNEHLSRVRNILNLMDRSIEDARAKRNQPLDTVPAISRPVPDSTPMRRDEGEARLPTSIFDRNGPRLKARPKRSND